MLASLKSTLIEQDFHPTWWGALTNPFYFARRGILRAVKEIAPTLSGRCLDIGCGNKQYLRYYTHVSEYVGLEYDTPSNRHKKADAFYDGTHFPFDDESFDVAVSNEVFEHVFNPKEHLAEIHRVLKPGGLLFMTVPFVWDEHEQPHDFARYTSFGLRYLLEAAGFEVCTVHKTAADVTVVFQLLNAYIYKKTLRLRRSLKMQLLSTLFCNAPVTMLGLILEKLLPANTDLYLDTVVLVRKKT